MRGALLVALAILAPRAATAQVATRPLAVEARADGIFARRATATHVGVGLARRASRNLEMALVLAGGITTRDELDDPRASARADVLGRFAPAPASPTAWTAYASVGVGGLFERGTTGRAVLVLLAGVRGQRAFVEAGLGGGLRLGAGLRL
ncbi:MAG TPA: hypothetical protein VFH14_05400 [Gemmatimonadaceae bacterium]|nr:hypothetical protein [Gemmatimonadaceae bacterium]